MDTDTAPNRPANTGEVAPAFLVLRGVAGLLQFASVALIAAPGLASFATRQFGFEESLPHWWIRAAGVAGFLLTAVARIALPGGGGEAARARALSKLADATGGSYRLEKRRLDARGTTGGPAIEWTLQGHPVTLTGVSRRKGTGATVIYAEFPCAKELRFTVLPNNFLTRTLTSPKFVLAVQTNIQRGEGDASVTDRADAAKEIGLLAGADVTLAHPLLDGRLIAKSNDADLARYILTGGGVAERMNDLTAKRKGWTLSLYSAERGGVGRLALEFPGSEWRPEPLVAGRELFDALLGNLRQNGVLAEASGGFEQDEFPRRASR